MIKLMPHLEEDIPLRVQWLNNEKYSHFVVDKPNRKTTIQDQKQWFVKYKKDPKKIFFTIYDDSVAIGLVGLSNIDKKHGQADLFIMIGDDRYRGRGIGKIVMEQIIDYAFNKLNLSQINAEVKNDNIPALSLNKSCGFQQLDEVDDRYPDEIQMVLKG